MLLHYFCHCRKKRTRAVAQCVVSTAHKRGGGGNEEASSCNTNKEIIEALSIVLQGNS